MKGIFDMVEMWRQFSVNHSALADLARAVWCEQWTETDSAKIEENNGE